MITTITILLTVLALILLVPALTFSIQCFLSIFPTRKEDATEINPDIQTAVLIPAHNEQEMISGIIGDVKSQLGENGRVIVIADNCTDNTAQVSRQHGAEVIERTNAELRGKPYAIDYAMEQLTQSPPDIVMIVDADCRISPGTIAMLSNKAAKLNRPVQGSYIFGSENGSEASNVASSFTLWFRNHIRPVGSLRLGMPCQLTGSGMAFPWAVLSQIKIGKQSLADDTILGSELICLGYPPIFCPEAKIDGSLPKKWGAMVQQRRRWEQGYLEAIFSFAPRMLMSAITKLKPSLLWATLDLCIPPLALLGMAWFALFAVTLFCTTILEISFVPLMILLATSALIGISLFLGWFFHCRGKVSPKAIVALPWFLIRKVGIYTSLLAKREKAWLRTERD